MTENIAGLIVHRGSRTERLADALARRLEAERPANPLAPQTVVVAHPGLKRWLLGRFAQRPGANGGHGIAANIEMILPWQWFERVARSALGEEALIGGAYRHELLRWRLMQALPTLAAPEITTYLAGDDSARRRFQLAEYLAGLYTQYLIYRPQWLLDWEQHPTKYSRDWQAVLWRQVQQGIGRPHRAQRSGALIDTLRSVHRAEDPPLHVFGISHLAPDVMAALQAYAGHRSVHLYFPDPCREHWVYLRRQRFLLAQQDDPDALYFEVGHPLLIALGRIAQDFCLTLDDCEAIDERDAMDDAEPLPGESSLLARVQSSIRCMAPELVGEPLHDAVRAGVSVDVALRAMRADPSLRVHACHTRLRELEVVKDTLLRSLADDPTLQHRDIVVMAPDISAYAPYLAAVFGEQAQYRSDPSHVPWHLADVGLSRAHPLISAFAQLLDLAESRFTVSEIMDFLDVPAVARRFSIDPGSREALERWLHRAHVAWGLDAAMKAAAGGAPDDANSWQFGLDRLYAGLILGQDPGLAAADGSRGSGLPAGAPTGASSPAADAAFGDAPLLDGILPLDGVSGAATEAIGQLDRLLGELRAVRETFGTSRSLASWGQWLLDRIDALFLADLRDDAENSALDTLRRLAASLVTQATETGLNAPLPWSIVREALGGALDAVPERQPFLLGGVTFCGLVPQRSIPFRVICLLGMNEGEFPRPGHDAGLNRILNKPRRGDRDTRSEDRYLFLEALMSSRDALHISFVGEGVRDGKPRNPAAPLAELLQFLDEQHGIAADQKIDRPWSIRHPLQPFDVRYYERDAEGQPLHDPRLFSYNSAFVAGVKIAVAAPFLGAATGATEYDATAVPAAADISLAALKRYWRDPAKDSLLRQRGISLEALENTSWPDREPLETRFSRLERIDRQLLFDALSRGRSELPDEPPAWLGRSGILASGAIGVEAYRQLKQSVQGMLSRAQACLGGIHARNEAQAIALELGDGMHLTGSIDRVFRSNDGGLLLFDAKPGGVAGLRDLLTFYIDWAALRLTHGDGIEGIFLEATPAQKVAFPKLLEPILAQDTMQLRRGLRQLIQMRLSADSEAPFFFPVSALAYASSAPEERTRRAADKWAGAGYSGIGERDYAPGYSALLLRGSELFDERSAAFHAFVETTRRVGDVLDPTHSQLMKAAASATGLGTGADA